jgi:hypothetical protein
MKLSETMIAWTPPVWGDRKPYAATKGQVKAGIHPAKGWSAAYAFTDGACLSEWRAMNEWERVAMLFIMFNVMTVRDGIDPKVAHDALLEIDEYRHRIAPDMRGANRE